MPFLPAADGSFDRRCVTSIFQASTIEPRVSEYAVFGVPNLFPAPPPPPAIQVLLDILKAIHGSSVGMHFDALANNLEEEISANEYGLIAPVAIA
jgi:hypothetical protein